MIFHRYPHPEQIPIEADKWSYIRHAKRSRISAVEVAHLAYGFVAKVDSALVFLNPILFEVSELYTLLIDAVECGKINDASCVDGSYKAPLLDWCTFLRSINHPLPKLLLCVLDEEIKLIENLKNQPPSISSNHSLRINTKSNRGKLEEEILRLSKNFPKIPRKYYILHPDINPLKPPSMTDGGFEDLVTAISKKANLPKRKRGSPLNDFLDVYETAHPEQKEWFQKIREKKNASSKIKR